MQNRRGQQSEFQGCNSDRLRGGLHLVLLLFHLAAVLSRSAEGRTVSIPGNFSHEIQSPAAVDGEQFLLPREADGRIHMAHRLLQDNSRMVTAVPTSPPVIPLILHQVCGHTGHLNPIADICRAISCVFRICFWGEGCFTWRPVLFSRCVVLSIGGQRLQDGGS
jgi:hypothetical protein